MQLIASGEIDLDYIRRVLGLNVLGLSAMIKPIQPLVLQHVTWQELFRSFSQFEREKNLHPLCLLMNFFDRWGNEILTLSTESLKGTDWVQVIFPLKLTQQTKAFPLCHLLQD